MHSTRRLVAISLIAAVIIGGEVALLTGVGAGGATAAPATTSATITATPMPAPAQLAPPAPVPDPGRPVVSAVAEALGAALAWAPAVSLPSPIHPDEAHLPSAQQGEALFRLGIAKIGLDVEVYPGVDLDTLSWGPGHWPGSALPGERGNMVIAGHRVTWTRPFYDLDLLAPGDVVEAGGFRYEIDKVFVVAPEDTWIINPTSTPSLTLFACHPKHSAAQRIVVTASVVPN